MWTRYLITIFLLGTLLSLGQTGLNCFMQAKINHDAAINRGPTMSVGDSTGITELLSIAMSTINEVTGCRYPATLLKDVQGKEIKINEIKSDFIIINFNYLYDANSLMQLNDLDSIKKQLRKRVTIISIFQDDKKEIQYLVDKYLCSIDFASNSGEYIKYYNLGLGAPTTFLLDKNKIIRHISFGSYPDKGHLYSELVKYF